jgi:hypothetical protein
MSDGLFVSRPTQLLVTVPSSQTRVLVTSKLKTARQDSALSLRKRSDAWNRGKVLVVHISVLEVSHLLTRTLNSREHPIEPFILASFESIIPTLQLFSHVRAGVSILFCNVIAGCCSCWVKIVGLSNDTWSSEILSASFWTFSSSIASYGNSYICSGEV